MDRPILWTSMYNDGTSINPAATTCSWTSAGKSSDWIVAYTGTCGVAPTAVPDLPTTCSSPTCADGIQNGNETGVDSGGSCPSCADGIQNGDETGADSGGSCATCSRTYEGGCGNWASRTLDMNFEDRAYTQAECYGKCKLAAGCAGFLLGTAAGTQSGHCLLAKAGCWDDDSAAWDYYAMQDCHEGARKARTPPLDWTRFPCSLVFYVLLNMSTQSLSNDG